MTLSINGTITIQPVQSRAFTTTRADSGFASQAMTVTGYTDRTATLAAAKEVARQLNEMASNYWYRVVHIADSEDSQYDGRYELQGASVTATPTTSNSNAALFAVQVTLLRLGGGSTNGANLTRRVSTVAALNANSYSITGASVIPVPVGAYPLLTTASTLVSRTGADGFAYGLYTTTWPVVEYTMSGADVNKGECKLWDTGSGGSGVRVWSADHTFANDADVLLDNGLVRIGGTATDGCHFVQVWDQTNGAWTNAVTSDLTTVAGTATHVTRKVTIDELSPWRVTVTWTYSMAVTPFLWSKSVTVERGKYAAKVVITPVAAATIKLRPMNVRFLLTRRTADTACARDDTVDAVGTISIATDNVIMGFNAIVDDVLFVASASSTSLTVGLEAGPLEYISTAAAASMTVWLGGIPYDCTDAYHEAETGSLLGAATTTSTLSSDSGNSVVQMDALNERVSMVAQNTHPAGTHVIAWFRIASSVAAGAGNAGDVFTLGIWNNTAVASAASTTTLATNATYYTTANALTWLAVEYTSWNGTDELYPYVSKTSSATAQAFYLDEVVVLTFKGPNADKPDDVGALAMTENYFWESTTRAVW
jgi:hypothetical protein